MKKYEKFYQECRAAISALPPGSPVPSVRELMRSFGLSQVTVTRALRQLKQERLIEARIGSGTVRAGLNGEAPPPRLTVAFLASDYPSTFGATVRRTFEEYFTGRGYGFEAFYFSTADVRRGRLRWNGRADALILNSYFDCNANLVRQLTELPVPHVCIDIMPQGLPLNAVCTDNEFGGALVANWFWQQGHRDCAVLQSQPHFYAPEARQRGFVRQLRLHGAAPVTIDCQTPIGTNATANAYQVFRCYIEQHGAHFSALFCDSDLGSLGVFRACRELGIAVPEQLSIIGFDNIPECSFFHPALASVDQNVAGWAAETERIILARRHQPTGEALQSYILPELRLRQSAAMPTATDRYELEIAD